MNYGDNSKIKKKVTKKIYIEFFLKNIFIYIFLKKMLDIKKKLCSTGAVRPEPVLPISAKNRTNGGKMWKAFSITVGILLGIFTVLFALQILATLITK